MQASVFQHNCIRIKHIAYYNPISKTFHTFVLIELYWMHPKECGMHSRGTAVELTLGGNSEKTVFFGIFFQNGGGVTPIPKLLYKTKSFLACQIHPKMLKHVFHTGGSNIWSILFIKIHLILSFSLSLREKNGLFWEFCPEGQHKRFASFFFIKNL